MKIRAFLISDFINKVLPRFFTVYTLFLLILTKMLYPQSDNLIIEHITGEQGLSSPMINCIVQDREGYLWFATEKGIGRYDGYSYQSYINNPGDTTSFVNAAANSIYIDKEGTLWFGSMHGLEKYDRTTNTFTNYLPDRSAIEDQTGNTVYNMIEDNWGNFWVSTGKGIFRFNKNSGKFSHVQYDNHLQDTLNTWFGQLYVDKDRALWVGTRRGLDKFNYETGKMIHYWHDPENLETGMNTVSKYYIRAICEDNDRTLWLGTSNGLVEFNKKSNTFTNYIPDPQIHSAFNINQLSALCYDSRGVLWVGSGTGIFTFDTKLKKFIPQFINKSIHNLYLGNNFIISLFIDRSGALWSGTLADGIYKVILRKLPYKKYFPGLCIYDVIKGGNGILWIKKAEGWVKFDTKTDQITPTSSAKIQVRDESGNIYLEEFNSAYVKKIENKKIVKYNLLKAPSTICFGMTVGMWYGALEGGLYYLDFKTGKVTETVKTNTFLTAICKDSSDLVWAAIYMEKLICYDPKNKSVSEFVSDPKNPLSISGREIFKIYEDKKGRLWFATDAGLNRFIPSTKTFIHYTEKDGLSGNTVYNILEDNHGNLWIDTDKGISKFDPETNKFTNFDILQGFSTSDWYYYLEVKMDNGEMFFGRSYGLIRFHPDSIKENTYIPPIVITSFKLFDKPVPFGKEIKLAYNKNFLSFEFAALSYYHSQRNQYAYKMEGIDKDWIYSGTRRFASYPNLSPGKYIFRVKGSNNDGIWNEVGTSLSIIISPPWWETTWAYFIYGFIFVFTLYGLRRYELNRVKLKDKIKMDAAVLREREETDKIKSRFFANISHEFRTPLTLILGPIEKIIARSTDEDNIKDAGIVKRNSKRLLQLVNQLLDLSKLEAGRLKLEASRNNIVSFVKGIALSFESLSEEKDITLKIESEKEYIEVYIDKEKMLKILSNILSNAFKFTPQNGKITVSVSECHAELGSASFIYDKIPDSAIKSGWQVRNDKLKNFVEIKIRDTGIGIPADEIPKLFDRFYQVDSSFTKEHEGTGIGLALTKELIELHHGSISVQSENGKWTEFTLYIPLGKDHLTDENIVQNKKTDKTKDLMKEDYYFIEDTLKERGDEIEVDSSKEEKNIILIVEDNYDMREYIKESLGDDYFIEEAVNGEQGIRKAEDIIPDLIISDMMMPKMDGNEMTRILKSDERTSHIPVIILTAKSGQENKLEGLKTGADDYLTKPFDIRELQIRIKNLISLRKKLQQKISRIGINSLEQKDDNISDKPVKLRSIDEKFLNKIRNIVNEHISEENFSIEELGNEIGMSRSQVLRKIKALTGKSPSLYVRSIRLLKAKEMIENGDGNISEIAYSVGFSSPVYFSKCFKEEFGYSPKNFIM